MYHISAKSAYLQPPWTNPFHLVTVSSYPLSALFGLLIVVDLVLIWFNDGTMAPTENEQCSSMIYRVPYSGRSYASWLSIGGATVGTCVYKTANIKGKALHVA